MQTLNMVNAVLADKYQLGAAADSKPEATPPDDKKTEDEPEEGAEAAKTDKKEDEE